MSLAIWLWLTTAAAAIATVDAPESIESEPAAQTLRIDAARTAVDFQIAALWILRRSGRFDGIDGTLEIAAGGESAQIRVRIQVDSVHMKDPDHVELLLSPAFFDAARYPLIEFESEPFALSDASPLALPGRLTLRGISRQVRFNLDLRQCRPGPPAPCKVIVDGVLRRSQFGMTEYRRTLAEDVHLRIAALVAE